MWFIVFISLVLLAVLIAVGVGVSGRRQDKTPPKVGGIIAGLVVLGLLGTLCFSISSVGARAVGVGIQLNKYHGTYDSGWQFTDPIIKMEDFSTQLQYLKLNDGKKDDEAPKPVVSFAGGGNGQIAATITWKVDPANVQKLWQDHQTFDRVRDRLVEPKAANAIRRALGGYTATDAQDGLKTPAINESIKTELQSEVSSSGITVVSVTYDGPTLDEKTQASITRTLQLKQETIAAKQDKLKAEAEKEANDVRAKSGLLTDAAQRQKCLDLVANWDHNRQGDMPATWNCVPGQAVPVAVGVNPANR